MDGLSDRIRIDGVIRTKGAVSVLLAQDADGNELVVKHYDASTAVPDSVGVERFRRELLIATSIRHPGLPRILDHGEGWIAFERLKGPLADVGWRRAFATASAATGLLRDLAETLAHIHACGIVHRDIKPMHVMFRDARPVLIDFGAAGLISDDPLSHTELVGAPAWMAPEQAFGAPPRPESDIWSLCALAAWLLTGRPPFEGNADVVLDARRRGEAHDFDPPDLDRKAPAFARVLISGLGPATARPTAAEIIHALELPKVPALGS